MTILVQLLLSTVILTLTVLVTIAAIQVFHLLKDLRQVVHKLNRILDNTAKLSDASSRPLTAVNEFFTEVKTLVDETEGEIVDSTPDRVIPESRIRRFFHRSGAPPRPS